ncbi:hypothetical protein EYF80_022041 [Liparis tanakae]|uniref:Uncharacterized protein n=1 Tax=Liparis tanakae TaxID=230148 RepID=A0A4Z2HQZ3_9TELE|nr:hypothetical protein EYF80_022041 [Liparis tanakae]
MRFWKAYPSVHCSVKEAPCRTVVKWPRRRRSEFLSFSSADSFSSVSQEPKQEEAVETEAAAHQRVRQRVLRRGAHQYGDAPGRTGARAAAPGKLATGQVTG